MLRGSVSPDPSKIPYGGFSPVRLQGSTTALFFRAHPSSRASLMRPQCSPSLHGGGLPLSRHAEHVGSAFASLSTPLPHGSFAPPGLCCPSASSLLRPDPPVLRSPPPPPLFSGKPFRPLAWCSPSLRPQVSLALLTGRTFRPRGLLPELTPSTVAHRERQALLRSQTGPLLRRGVPPPGEPPYTVHPAHRLPTGFAGAPRP